MSPRAGLRCRPWRVPASGPGGRTARVGGGPRGLRTRHCAARPAAVRCTNARPRKPPRCRTQVSSRLAMIAISALSATASAASPRRRQDRSIGNPWPTTCGKPSCASATAPPAPYRSRACSPCERPPLTIRAGSGSRASCAAKATASVMFSATATPADRSPSAHNAPRCVLTPSVVLSMRRSPARPMSPMRSRRPGPNGIDRAASAHSRNGSRSASAEVANRARLMSGWLCLPRCVDQPGFRGEQWPRRARHRQPRRRSVRPTGGAVGLHSQCSS